jgi:hypothetical protein
MGCVFLLMLVNSLVEVFNGRSLTRVDEDDDD